MERQDLITLLKSTVVTVNFEKVDGSMREMICTLMESELPPVVEGESSTKRRPESETKIPVWDTVVGGWRSFRVDSVKSINGVDV